jgi:hypothetical protein
MGFLDSDLMEDLKLTPPAPASSQILRLVGIILILSFLLDLLVSLVIAPQYENVQWQLNIVAQSIDRGIAPLIGFALIYAGFWIQTAANGISRAAVSQRAAWQDWRFWAFVFSSLLGLLFLLGIIFHVHVTGRLVDQAVKQLNDQATQQEAQMVQEINQLKTLAANPQLEQILKSNQIPPQQQMLLRQAQQNPQALDQLFTQKRQQMETQKKQAMDQAQSQVLSERVRMGIRSFLMAIGFITIGWSGLRDSR